MNHGLSKTRVYRIWAGMISRCTDPNHSRREYYGGRGITVCPEWADPLTFIAWALENGYAANLSLDRVDNDGDYEPSNCRWVSKAVQARNSCRLTKRNSSGYRGVSRLNGRWGASLRIDSLKHHLGTFDTPLCAAHAYDKYVADHNLEHTLNFPPEV